MKYSFYPGFVKIIFTQRVRFDKGSKRVNINIWDAGKKWCKQPKRADGDK